MDQVIIKSDGTRQIVGQVAGGFQRVGFNANALRPYLDKHGQYCITSYVNGKKVATPVPNTHPAAYATTLRKDEWKYYDQTVLEEAKLRLNGIQDLRAAGLVMSLQNGLGKMVLEYEKIADFGSAQMSMDARARGVFDRPQWTPGYLPLPIIHSDYEINIRQLEASRTTGEALDTTQAGVAAQKVVEYAETILFQGTSSYTFGDGVIYGYCDFPDRNKLTISPWDQKVKESSTAEGGEGILTDLVAAKQMSIDDRHYGPWTLYIPTNWSTSLDYDFKAGSDKSIRQRLLEVEGISAIKTADYLAADNAVLVQMTKDTVRLVEGLSITPLQWQPDGPMTTQYKVMAIWVPQIRSTSAGRCGIVHMATSF